MDDDDEFGDLYTDVLTTFPSSATAEEPPPPSDLNPQIRSEEITSGASDSGFAISLRDSNQTPVAGPPPPASSVRDSDDAGRLEDREARNDGDFAGVSGNSNLGTPERTRSRVLESGGEKVDMDCENREARDKSRVGVVEVEGDDIVDVFKEKRDDFDVQEDNTGIGDVGSEPVIPGLSIQGATDGVDDGGDADFWPRGDVGAEGDDWDSDSEDDLQIVLNDNTHTSMGMAGDVLGSGDEDEDGEPLVILGNDDPNHQQMEEQEWGEDAAQSADGDRKDVGEAGKANGGTVAAPKVGYSGHAYHSFHSQFKYVRPGAAPVPGAANGGPGGGPGQVRPLGNLGSIAGRGRGDWRPTGIKVAPSMQKNFHSGYAISGRGFGGGLEFTLPSHKTIFEVGIDGFEEKPWKLPGVDISDYFNFGLNEDSWKDYCKQLEQIRLEATMQSRIRVYESGRTEKGYDPDLPPELAAAAGIHGIIAENANPIKVDAGQGDLAKGSSHMRPPIPTGRAIQVESGYGERLPSIDTRPPRIRDSDAIIEIVLQGTIDDESSAGNDVVEQPDNDTQREVFGAVQDENAHVDTEYCDEFPLAHNIRKREAVETRDPFMSSSHDKIPEADGDESTQCHLGSRGQISVYRNGDFSTLNEKRQTKERTRDRLPVVPPNRSSGDKEILDNQDEGSVESIDGKYSPLLSSPVMIGVSRGQSDDHEVNEQDERILADEDSRMGRNDMNLDAVDTINKVNDEDLIYPVKEQMLGSQVEQPVLRETDDIEELKATGSGENSKEKSGNSKGYQRRYDSTEEEVLQDRHMTHFGDTKRHLDEDESSSRRTEWNEKQGIERHRMVVKRRDESYSNSAHYSHKKTEVLGRRKERDVSDAAWQKRDEDPRGRRTRAEDAKKRERGDEIGSRHRGKIRESERSDKDEHLHSRKQVDNGSWRGYHDMELGSRHKEREDNLKIRYDDVGVLHSKRRKDEEYPRRDNADKEEVLHGYRESTNRRKRERDEITDQRKRDDRGIIRDNPGELHSIRQKDDGWLQRERIERRKDDRHRVKQPHEENLAKREREGCGAVRSVRGGEEKVWVNQARVKDDYSGSDKDYPIKDTGRHTEQHKRRDRIEAEPLHRVREEAYARANQFSSEDRRSRQERSSSHSNRVDNERMQEKKRKDDMRKSKESENGNHKTSLHTKRNQEDLAGHVTASLRGTRKQEILQSSKKQRGDPSSDDEQQDSRRGRSKLERWASHKEREDGGNAKSPSPLKVKEIDTNNSGPKAVEAVDNQWPSPEEREAGDPEINDADTKPMEDRHLDTFAKLKKRSERFNLPMPREKDPAAIKKMENEALPSAQSEAPADLSIKQERPPRKRRWISK